jgi:hypothetical protein
VERDQTVAPQQIAKALQRRANCARHLDNARRFLIAAAREADDPTLRSVHLDVIGACARVDDARSQLVGSDE